MNKHLLFACISLTATLQCLGQPETMILKVPAVSFATCLTKYDVTLFKEMSTQGQYLVERFGESSSETCEYVWSGTPAVQGTRKYKASLGRGKVLPAIATHDGWTRVVYQNHTPWIHNTTCNTKPLSPLQNNMKHSSTAYPLTIRTSGTYENYCLYYVYPDGNEGGIYIGYLNDRLAVMPLFVMCSPEYNSSTSGVHVAHDDNGNLMVTFGYDAAKSMGYSKIINLDMLSDNDISTLLRHARVAEEEVVVYSYDNILFSFTLDPKTYEGRLTNVSKDVPVVKSHDKANVQARRFTSSGSGASTAVVETEPQEPAEEEETIVNAPDEAPEFPGGIPGLYSWMGENIRYPQTESFTGKKRVVISFIVQADGAVSNVKVKTSAGEAFDAEAVRLVESMPKWTPGKVNGQPVNVSFSLPITFQGQ